MILINHQKVKIIKRIQGIPLSARTSEGHKCSASLSLTLDESTDVSHLSQFSVIASCAVGDTLSQESLAILPIKASTRGEDFFQVSHGVCKRKESTEG